MTREATEHFSTLAEATVLTEMEEVLLGVAVPAEAVVEEAAEDVAVEINH